MPEWYEDDDFWREMAPVVFTPERIQQGGEEVERIVKLVGAAPGATLLDLGCGIGRHSLEFARRGLAVTGVDRSAYLLSQARLRVPVEGPSVEWVHEDMRQFRRPAAFEFVVSLLTSFGYFTDPADDRLVLENCRESLRAGGVLILDIMSKEVLARIFRPRDWHREGTELILLEERSVEDEWRWLNVHWTLLRGSNVHRRAFRLRLYAASELVDLFRATGFREVRCFGSLTGKAYDQEAERLVIVART